jgi:hypothetical protein
MPEDGSKENSTWPMPKFRFKKYLNKNSGGAIYDRSTSYIQIAKFNSLNRFRHVKDGIHLIFPPIVPARKS